MATRDRTINMRVWNFEIVNIDNGIFTVEILGGRGTDKDSDERVKVRVRFEGLWWITIIAGELWKVITRRRQQLEDEIKKAETSMRETSS